MARKGTFYDGFESSVSSYLGSVILLAIIPSALSNDFITGLILIVIYLALAIISLIESIQDIQKKSFGWVLGLLIGLLIFDKGMLLAIILILALVIGYKHYTKEYA